jgi:hypothetical protein
MYRGDTSVNATTVQAITFTASGPLYACNTTGVSREFLHDIWWNAADFGVDVSVAHDRRWSSSAGLFHVARGTRGCLLGCLPLLTRNDVGGVPPRPVVLRGRRLVLAMPRLCLTQKFCQGRDVQAESSSGKSRLDLLEQPTVAVWIAE